jgi:hypothetical protein
MAKQGATKATKKAAKKPPKSSAKKAARPTTKKSGKITSKKGAKATTKKAAKTTTKGTAKTPTKKAAKTPAKKAATKKAAKTKGAAKTPTKKATKTPTKKAAKTKGAAKTPTKKAAKTPTKKPAKTKGAAKTPTRKAAAYAGATPKIDKTRFVDAGTAESEEFDADEEIQEEFSEVQRLAGGGEVLMRELREHHDTSPILAGGDVDADWEHADTGEETVGGSAPTPGQDVVDELGEAVGLTYEDNEPLHTTEKLDERDRHRWELDPASSDDYNVRVNREGEVE